MAEQPLLGYREELTQKLNEVDLKIARLSRERKLLKEEQKKVVKHLAFYKWFVTEEQKQQQKLDELDLKIAHLDREIRALRRERRQIEKNLAETTSMIDRVNPSE